MRRKMMQYKGYQAEVAFDDTDGVWYGRIIGIRDVVTFQAEDPADLERELVVSVEDYLAFCAEQGVDPDRPAATTPLS